MTVCSTRRARVHATALLALSTTLLWTSPAGAESVTLDRALALADAQHPLLRVGEAQLAGAAAAIITAQARPNPEVAFVAGRLTAGLGSRPQTGVPLYEVLQPLELGRLRPARIEFAERGRESGQHLLAEIRLSVLANVRRTFYQVLRRVGEAELAAENLSLVEDLRNRVQVRFTVGEVGRLELVRAEAEVASARALAASAALQRVAAEAQFRAAVGGGLDADVTVVGTLDEGVTLPPIETLRREAASEHPGLRRARSEIMRADARVGYETALKRPQPTIWSEIDMSNPSYRIGMAIPLPIFNQRQGPIAEAEAARRQAAAASQAREIEVLTLLDGAYERYALAGAQVAQFETGLLREAEEAVRAAEVAYQLGERSILDVLDAQRVLRTVRINYLNVRFDRQAALVDLDELRGRLAGGIRP